jgi:hypothetical protein
MDAGIKTEQEKLRPEAANAKKALETAIPGVLWMRPTPMDGGLGLVRFSSARPPPSLQQKPQILQRLWLHQGLSSDGAGLSVE